MNQSGGRTEETTRYEVKLSSDGRLLLVQWFSEGSNFWVHPDGECSFVPTERDIMTLKLAYEAIDTFNQKQIIKKAIESERTLP